MFGGDVQLGGGTMDYRAAPMEISVLVRVFGIQTCGTVSLLF